MDSNTSNGGAYDDAAAAAATSAAAAPPGVPPLQLVTYVNGRRLVLPPGRGEATLLQFLRENGLTGTKLGCGEGGCGACTVMVSAWDPVAGAPTHRAVNACLCPLYAVEGAAVLTVEGIGSVRGGLHPVQAALANAHGSQCGFCTPGFVMSMYALLRARAAARLPPPTEHDIEHALGGNLCRCTGYRPILAAFGRFAAGAPYSAEAAAAAAGMVAASAADSDEGGAAARCPSTGLPCDCGAGIAGAGAANKGCAAQGCCGIAAENAKAATAATSEPIFPRELKGRPLQALTLPGPRCTWHRPTSLVGLLEVVARHGGDNNGGLRLVGGATEVAIELKFKHAGYSHLAAVASVPELHEVAATEHGLRVGAGVTLTRLDEVLSEAIATQPRTRTRGLASVRSQLRWFAGAQVRGVATLGGNIATASPISDLNPLWMALGATFTLARLSSGDGDEKITTTRDVAATDFFIGYRRTAMLPNEVLLNVFVPFTADDEFVSAFKQSPRRDDDIAIVNAGMRARLELRPSSSATAQWVVADAVIAYGGVAPKSILAPKAAAALIGRPWSQEALDAALDALRDDDVRVEPTAPGGRGEYRNALAASFLFKFHAQVTAAMAAAHPDTFAGRLAPRNASAASEYERPPLRGVQLHHAPPPAGDVAEVGRAVPHASAMLQTTGEALYTDDEPLPPSALHAAFVLSTKPHAQLLSVDPAPALALPGVVGYFGASDVPGSNAIGPVARDELVFVPPGGHVTCVGAVIGVIVADTEAAARDGARAVVVAYGEDLPAIVSIDDARAAGSFYESYAGRLERGDVDAAFEAAAFVVEGELRLGGQEHFYLEPNACLVLPREHDEFVLVASTQAPHKHQAFVATTLGVPMHKLTCRAKRIGGGFGGKETRSIFLHCAAAVPAWHTRRAVRAVLDRDEDMQMTGGRHPFLARYRVGVSASGDVTALDVQLYANAGNSLDLSTAVMDRALMHACGVYRVPAVRATGRLCRTHVASNTAFRGFGGPQGLMAAEVALQHAAAVACGGNSVGLRRRHLLRDGDVTHFGMAMEGCRLAACWDAVLAQAGGWEARRAAVDAFNAQSRWRKRGLALTPTMFGIAFTKLTYNQGGALVHVYTDGTVLVSHGGVEMGQGLHTKMAQVAATALAVPLAAVHVVETATDKVPNASPTAGSASTDLYGMAVLDACRQIAARLAPYRRQGNGDAAGPTDPRTFAEAAAAAYADRIDLSAHGFYATPDITGAGGARPFNYFVFGAAVSEVELDALTGDWHARRSDVVMDVGNPVNPAIDVGQVEGGFVQGVGWLCLEELVWGDAAHPWVPRGALHTRGPGAYKIPAANDAPHDLRVTLLQGHPNPRAVHSSKAVGEPPFHLGASVFFALKDAVGAARADAGHGDKWFALHAPATPERLRMACADKLTAKLGVGLEWTALGSY